MTLEDAPGKAVHGSPWEVGGSAWNFSRPLVMGVVNVTPDSFSDGGDCVDPGQALDRALELAAEGADILDIGGASSHPRARNTSPGEELRRVLPLLERLAAQTPVPLSIDTTHPAVAEACLEAGAHLINDVSGLPAPDMARVAAGHDAPLVITWNNFAQPRSAQPRSAQPRPAAPPGAAPRLEEDMLEFFRLKTGEALGQGARRLILDPGYGFGKTIPENLALLRALPRLQELGWPVLVCTSRKGSLGRITGEENPRELLGATIGSTLFAVVRGAHIVRVHDVKPLRQALELWRALEQGGA